MTYLSQFLTMEWLMSEHVDMMMDLLQQSIFAAGLGSKVELASKTGMFMSKVKQAYEKQEEYCTINSQEFHWIQWLGQDLANGRRAKLWMVVNVRNNHWVSVGVDVEHGTLWHGGSLGNDVDLELRLVLKWWILI